MRISKPPIPLKLPITSLLFILEDYLLAILCEERIDTLAVAMEHSDRISQWKKKLSAKDSQPLVEPVVFVAFSVGEIELRSIKSASSMHWWV